MKVKNENFLKLPNCFSLKPNDGTIVTVSGPGSNIYKKFCANFTFVQHVRPLVHLQIQGPKSSGLGSNLNFAQQ